MLVIWCTKQRKISLLHASILSEALLKNIQVLIAAIIISRSAVQHSAILKEAWSVFGLCCVMHGDDVLRVPSECEELRNQTDDVQNVLRLRKSGLARVPEGLEIG